VPGTATIIATVNGGAIPSRRVYSWAGTGFGTSAQYSMPAPTSNTGVMLTVFDGASTVTKSVTVRPGAAIQDGTCAK
jgi:hypothetical protein